MPTPPELDALTAEQRAVYERFPANLMRYLVLAQASAGLYLDLGISFRYSTLTPQDRECVILRVGSILDNPYEAMQHTDIARSLGVGDAVIDKLLSKATDFQDPRLGRLVTYVDAAVTNTVCPEMVEALTSDFTDRQIAEIALLTGHYVMTSIFLKSLNVPLDAGPTSWGDVPQ
ncbi:alkylhydroperoxidase family enzyme [Mycobacterium sp. MAA66]|uniref:carboxymuconolactone decarboxylase family protein n=1 Tax=Mycobacterium sp. MAA66 TaxID=3156297 RepID=UPI0035126322